VRDPDGAPRQGAQRPPRAAQGRHRRLDQQAQEADQQNEAADRVRSILRSFKMLQDDQLKKTQLG
jgi:hypothetical protein